MRRLKIKKIKSKKKDNQIDNFLNSELGKKMIVHANKIKKIEAIKQTKEYKDLIEKCNSLFGRDFSSIIDRALFAD